MILKRVGSIKNKKNKKCLQCGRLMVGLKDNEVHRCGACGQKHYVDIYGTTLVLTAAERKDLRHRTEPKSQDDPEVVQKKKDQDEFKKRLTRHLGNNYGNRRYRRNARVSRLYTYFRHLPI